MEFLESAVRLIFNTEPVFFLVLLFCFILGLEFIFSDFFVHKVRFETKKKFLLHSVSNLSIMVMSVLLYYAIFFIVFKNINYLGIANHYKPALVVSLLGKNELFKFIISFVVYDFLRYIVHYFSHALDVLWVFHAVHHSDKKISVSTTFRNSFFTSVLEIPTIFVYVLLGMSFVYLPIILTIQKIYALYVHSPIFLNKMPGYFNIVFVSTDTHFYHHTLEGVNNNYGFIFSFWDRMFSKLVFVTPNEMDRLEFGVQDLGLSLNPVVLNLEPIIDMYKKQK